MAGVWLSVHRASLYQGFKGTLVTYIYFQTGCKMVGAWLNVQRASLYQGFKGTLVTGFVTY